MKRLFDAVIAGIGLLVLSPLLLMVAVAIRLRDGAPVLYRQVRVGRGFRPFRMYKFRTMRVGGDLAGPGVTVHNDSRVTALGRILRRSKLDELPQLYNVLKGDMSLVGPRPELDRYVRKFREQYRKVLEVRPGVTDLASIAFHDESALLGNNGDAETTYVRSILPEKLRLARHSVERGSLWNDLRLVLETVVVLLYPARLVDRLILRASRMRAIVTVIVQEVIAAAATLAALEIRFDGAPPASDAHLVIGTLPVLLIVRGVWFFGMGLHRDIWRHVGLRNLRRITVAVLLSSVTFALLLRWPMGVGSYPRSILLIDAMLCVIGMAGMRILRRVHHELRSTSVRVRRVLVIGADDSAGRLVRGLAGLAWEVEGLVGTDPATTGLRIHDIPIVGTCDQIEELLRTHDPDEILVVVSALPPESRKDIIRRCRASRKPVKVIPDLGHLMDGHTRTTDFDTPEAEDLLFRDPVPIDLAAVSARFRDRCVLVTGAGGSIGSEISMQVAACHPSRLVLLEKHEESLFHVEGRLRAAFPTVRVEPMIADIRDEERVNEIFGASKPEVVFHAAAYKHVPMMERNPREALKTNVRGTEILAEAAGRHGVQTFAFISTDKAVEPVCVMGASKRLAELTLRRIAPQSRTRFITVRFGNVLGSSGSVIPTFRDQIARRGPVTVTHPDVTRWFMTIPEAVHLILQSVTIGGGGEVFVLDMGKPVRVLDLARSLIRQYGMEPDRDIPIVYTGLRPGERLFEKLFNDHETICKTEHPRILMAVERHERLNGHAVAPNGQNGHNGHNGHHGAAIGNGNGNAHNGHNGSLNGHGVTIRDEERLRLLRLIESAEQGPKETNGAEQGPKETNGTVAPAPLAATHRG